MLGNGRQISVISTATVCAVRQRGCH